MKSISDTVVLTLCLFVLALAGTALAQPTWARTYGGADVDIGNSVQQTSDTGYIIAGSTWSFSNPVYLIKTNAFGDTSWTRTYPGQYDYVYSVRQTSDEGYVIVGMKPVEGGRAYLIKTNALGDTSWTRTYGGASVANGNSVQPTPDGGYILTGQTYSSPGGDVYLVKTDSLGDTLWTRTYGGAGGDEGECVQQTLDRGYVIAGWTTSYGSGYQVYLVKTDSSGDTVWTRTYGDTAEDRGRSVQQTSDRGYIIAGYKNYHMAGPFDVYLIKTDSLGDTLWTRTYGGPESDLGFSVQQTTDSGYIIAGTNGARNSDVWLIKTDSSGEATWSETYGGNDQDGGYSVQQTLDGGYVVAGYTCSFGAGDPDVYLIKADTGGAAGVGEESRPPTACRSPLTASVVRGMLEISLQPTANGSRPEVGLLDASGRRVAKLHDGPNDVSRLAPGVYFIKLDDGLGRTLRIVKVR